MDMRRIVVSLFPLIGFAGAAASAFADQLVLNSYGGPYEDIIRSRIIEPFEAESGIRVVYDAVGSSSQDYAKIKATGGRPGFDVVVMTAAQALQGCQEGLLEKLPVDVIGELSALSSRLSAVAGPCGAVHEVQYMSLLYRTDHVEGVPSSWNLLLDPALSGRVILPTFQNVMAVNLLQVMSAMNGGGLVADLDPGFAAMASIARQSVGFEQSSAILESYIKDGSVWAMPFWNGRAQLLVDSGAPVDYVRPSEGTIPLIATLSVPVGAENKAAAYRFIDFFLRKSSQEAWVEGYRVGSARSDIVVPEELRDRQIPEAELDQLLLPDLTLMAERMPEWSVRWDRDVVPAAR
ncbi:ABC transporter substrate-binding protein (plasmid) [Rhizobium sp. WL3]|uniref:ABC transporter substrate-binding protein n=1 Tax=Rhizobium sp. WL3 TaxID=2603277 RepID=UPI0011C1DAF0|nr:ABC transporter substrate-binding protein [Rhizobium sp. WL3]QEE43380.1 ABC transporter substrate-binding protein [Rhizobium sp. WL3]